MTNAYALISNEPGETPATRTAAKNTVRPQDPGFGCVYLSSLVREAERISALLEDSRIRIFHAMHLTEAEAQLKLTGARVLLTETTFSRGNWRDAMEMVRRVKPQRSLVVAARLPDERLWIGVLESGAYDLVLKPFDADELRRILENAHVHALAGKPRSMTA
jgi:DNA-binding NtrC family response regulator